MSEIGNREFRLKSGILSLIGDPLQFKSMDLYTSYRHIKKYRKKNTDF